MVFATAVLLTLSTFVKETATGIIDLPLATTVHAAELPAGVALPPAAGLPVSSMPVSSQPDTSLPLGGVSAGVVPTPNFTPAPGRPRTSAFTSLTRGMASWYGVVLHNHRTASGRRFNMFELTAAHRSLPFGSQVKVTDLRNHRSVIVTITDRGVLDADRVIDLSFAAAQQLDMVKSGVDPVSLEVLTAKQVLAASASLLPQP